MLQIIIVKVTDANIFFRVFLKNSKNNLWMVEKIILLVKKVNFFSPK